MIFKYFWIGLAKVLIEKPKKVEIQLFMCLHVSKGGRTVVDDPFQSSFVTAAHFCRGRTSNLKSFLWRNDSVV